MRLQYGIYRTLRLLARMHARVMVAQYPRADECRYNRRMKRILLIAVLSFVTQAVPAGAEDGTSMAAVFRREVDRRLDVPTEMQAHYAQLLDAALARAGIALVNSQYVLVLDRNANVQAVLVYWLDALALTDRWHFIGAAPASTGRPGKRGYFVTPTGVFAHTLENKDFRAEGTFNKLHIRGFGLKGMRVYDFGWVQAERGWGRGGFGTMRLLVHATDPDYLEQHLGKQWSKGCVRIPATLNTFIDHYGLLDGDYELALQAGKSFWVLRPDRAPTPWSGRYLVIVDSGSAVRPAWSPEPQVKRLLDLADRHPM